MEENQEVNNKKQNFIIKYQGVLSFVFCVIVSVLVYQFYSQVKVYFYDSNSYYELSKLFVQSGKFALTNFSLNIRGYFFCIVLFGIGQVCALINLDFYLGFAIFSSMFVSFLFTIVIPRFFPQEQSWKSLVGRILPFLIFMIWWSDLIYYPLTDIWGAGLMIIAAFCLLSISDRLSKLTIGNSILALIAGIILYGAYNTRTIYLFVIPVFLVVFIIFNIKKNIKNVIILLSITIAGIALCSIPQIIINAYHHDVATPLIITNTGRYNSNLFYHQLRLGIILQRFDTYVGNFSGGHTRGGIFYMDNVGVHITEIEKIEEITSLGQYLKLLIKYPLDFIGIYGRHLINALHLPYSNVYIKQMYKLNSVYAILNYIICFFSVLGMYIGAKTKKYINSSASIEVNTHTKWYKNQRLIYLLCSLIPCVIILLGAIELRFFVVMYILIYQYFARSIVSRDFYRYIRKNWLVVSIVFIVVLCILCAVWGNTFASIDNGPLRLS